MAIGYMRRSIELNEHREALKEAVEFLTPRLGEFEAIAFQGFSGACFAPSLCLALNKEMILVRKPKVGKPADGTNDTYSHSSFSLEISDHVFRESPILIVDDLISTGHTIEQIRAALLKNGNTNLVGVYLYNQKYMPYRVPTVARKGWQLPVWNHIPYA